MRKMKLAFAILAVAIGSTAMAGLSENTVGEENNCSKNAHTPADMYVPDYPQCEFSDEICCYKPNSAELALRDLPE